MSRIDLRWPDPRAIATPVAVLSPVALIVSAQEFVMGAVAALFLLHSWRTSDFAWAKQGWFVCLLALWAFSLGRTLLGLSPITSDLIALHWIHFPIYAAALATWILPDEKSRRLLLAATIATVAFYTADCLLQFFVGRDIIGRPMYGDRLTGVFKKPGVGTEIAWLFLPAVLGLWQMGRGIAAAALAVASVLVVVLIGDRMGMLLVIAEAFLVALMMRRLRKPALIALPLIALLGGAAIYLRPSIYQRQVVSTYDVVIDVVSHADRSPYGVVFDTAFKMAGDHWLLGVGVHNYQAACVDERYGPHLVGPDQLERCQGHPHNNYLQWLTENGAIGLALYCAFAVLILRRVAQSFPGNRDNLIFCGLVASLAMRFWPLAAGTNFYSSWSAEPLFLMVGWTLAYRPSAERANLDSAPKAPAID